MDCKLVLLLLVAVVAAAHGGVISPKTQLMRKASLQRRASNSNRLGIYDGKKTTIKEHPYMCAIQYEDELFGVATIVSKSWVIMGAELASVTPSDVSIITGSPDGSTGIKTYVLKTITAHPDYDGEFDYDVACGQIKGTFTYSAKVKAITLATKAAKSNTAMVVAGWGDTSDDDLSGVPANSGLYQGTMTWLGSKKCKSELTPYGVTWTARLACAYNKGKTTLCDGDWYDPFVYKKELYMFMIGVVESVWCSSEAVPVLCTNVPVVATWIKNITGAGLGHGDEFF